MIYLTNSRASVSGEIASIFASFSNGGNSERKEFAPRGTNSLL